MRLTFTEMHTPTVGLQIQVDRQLYTEQSDFQRIDVFECEFGRFLTLDGYMMLTERDEFIYHEMMVHVPLAVLGDRVKKVLVIGGGDGGCVRELCRYPHIGHIDLVEIDERVVAVCKEFLPTVACSLDDPRVHILSQDGLKYIRRIEDEYDLIIIDSTDPFGPGEGLFTMEFLRQLATRRWGNTACWSTSTKARSGATRSPAHRDRTCSLAPVPMHIPTYPSATGCSGSRRAACIQAATSTRMHRTPAASKPGITTPTCTRARSICPIMCRNCSKKWRSKAQTCAPPQAVSTYQPDGKCSLRGQHCAQEGEHLVSPSCESTLSLGALRAQKHCSALVLLPCFCITASRTAATPAQCAVP